MRVYADLHPPAEARNQEPRSWRKGFLRWKRRCFAEVDSEMFFRLAVNAARDGAVDIERFKARLRRCRGQINAVIASRTDPQTVIVLKGTDRWNCAGIAAARGFSTPRTPHTSTLCWRRKKAGVRLRSRP